MDEVAKGTLLRERGQVLGPLPRVHIGNPHFPRVLPSNAVSGTPVTSVNRGEKSLNRRSAPISQNPPEALSEISGRRVSLQRSACAPDTIARSRVTSVRMLATQPFASAASSSRIQRPSFSRLSAEILPWPIWRPRPSVQTPISLSSESPRYSRQHLPSRRRAVSRRAPSAPHSSRTSGDRRDSTSRGGMRRPTERDHRATLRKPCSARRRDPARTNGQPAAASGALLTYPGPCSVRVPRRLARAPPATPPPAPRSLCLSRACTGPFPAGLRPEKAGETLRVEATTLASSGLNGPGKNVRQPEPSLGAPAWDLSTTTRRQPRGSSRPRCSRPCLGALRRAPEGHHGCRIG